MRILAIGTLYPPHHQGGYELIWQGIMRRALAEGHDARILASDHLRGGDHPEHEVDVHRTLRTYWDWEKHSPPPLSLAQRWRLERHNAEQLRHHLGEFRPHVVSWWQMAGMSLSLIERVRRAGIPSLLTVLDQWPVYAPQGDAWLRSWRRVSSFARALDGVFGFPTQLDLTEAGRFLFISSYLREAAARAGIEPADADTVPAGIHARFLSPTPPSPWGWRLLYVGRVERTKGVDVALGALSRLPAKATLTVAGDGDPRFLEELHGQARTAGVLTRVHFRGAVPPDELPDIYGDADVVVFPPRWEEPWGLVPLEAMGMNRPVVASATGGSAEFLRDGRNALLFSPESEDELAARIRQLAADPALRRRLCEEGIRTAADHTAAGFERRVLAELVRAARVPQQRDGALA